MNMWMMLGLAVGAYVVGSIPFGIVASNIFKVQDPRKAGSGNIGFTNVLRVSGKKAGLVTLIGDSGKGLMVASLGKHFLVHDYWILLVALAVIIGHMFSCFLSFHGGKGVATGLGTIFGIDSGLGLILLMIWLGIFLIWRYSSVSGIGAFAVFPLLVYCFDYSWDMGLFSLCVSFLVIARHKDNIIRMFQGTESKVGNYSS